MTTKKPTKSTPSWSDVKTKLADFDRVGLLGLVQDLYAASKDNKAFLHARFGLGEDPLEPYKDVIIRWINPPDFRNPISVAKAKKGISDYKKALGQPEGLAELAVFYCEEAFDFLAGCGMDDEGYYDALVRMFEQALKYVQVLPVNRKRAVFLVRLDRVRQLGQNVGWDVGDGLDHVWSEAGLVSAG
ncbi:hypothetical protein [Castellaniella sp.]|uniref:hypothetical protein n=1 Tax=Castellaniella sp. TaxID=1955812 RepID=UPI002AFE5190|nr:hypothetical protein [Castellaniella sp.]